MIKKLIALIFIIVQVPCFADLGTCSRVAVVNFQEVLVDTSTHTKGEGLRFYLNKDPLAKNYLDLYQDKARPKWLTATIGTVGTSLILAGLFTSNEEGGTGLGTKDIFLIGGTATLLLNFLIAKTMDYANEVYLDKAVNEYNKRNLPKIYFSPFKNEIDQGRNPSGQFGMKAGFIQEF